MKTFLLLICVLFSSASHGSQWVPDSGNGRYKNPVLYADYSDPDIIKVGDDFYLVASSFNAMPGIPVLHSKDLVNWKIIGHVYDRLPFEKHDRQALGLGSWAPSIRYHDGLFYVYFCSPDLGLFVATAKNPAGPWDLKHMVDTELWEDPNGFWDDDGQAYLVRSKLTGGTLYLHKLSPDGKTVLDDGKVIYQDTKANPTIEGPKFLKSNGYYYIFAPAGGVATGWQTVLRSKSIGGPYEAKVVMHQGSTQINGPHQGGMVQLDSGEWWFLHFQDIGAYGRVAHLQPMVWRDDWPVIGSDDDGDGIGEPVAEWKKPNVGKTYPIANPQTIDEFNADRLGLQWQWQGNPKKEWYSLAANPGHLRLYAAQSLTQAGNLNFAQSPLLQKFPAPEFTSTAKISFHPGGARDKAGLVVMGREWAYLAFFKAESGVRLGLFFGAYKMEGDLTREATSISWPADPSGDYSAFLRVKLDGEGIAHFSYSKDGTTFVSLPDAFKAVQGVWIGAKVGLFNVNPSIVKSTGYMDVDWFRVE